jgi:hypothetical protein
MHPAALHLDTLKAQCEEVRTRRSGPGGQNRNKVETAIVLKHTPTGLTAQASERRSQAENRDAALFRLRIHLALQVRTPAAPDGMRSELWQSRCRDGRLSVNPAHDDFPALLAEALNELAAADWDTGPAAMRLNLTSSQLVRFLKLESSALDLLNRERQRRQLRPLR